MAKGFTIRIWLRMWAMKSKQDLQFRDIMVRATLDKRVNTPGK